MSDNIFNMSVDFLKAMTSRGILNRKIEIPLNGQSVYTVSLKKKVDPLEEVVVTGYQTRKKGMNLVLFPQSKLPKLKTVPTHP